LIYAYSFEFAPSLLYERFLLFIPQVETTVVGFIRWIWKSM